MLECRISYFASYAFQLFSQDSVSRYQIGSFEFLGVGPLHLVVRCQVKLSVLKRADKTVELERSYGCFVVEIPVKKPPTNGSRNSELFLELSFEALDSRFPRLDFAAREFPLSGLMLSCRPLPNQVSSASFYNGNG